MLNKWCAVALCMALICAMLSGCGTPASTPSGADSTTTAAAGEGDTSGTLDDNLSSGTSDTSGMSGISGMSETSGTTAGGGGGGGAVAGATTTQTLPQKGTTSKTTTVTTTVRTTLPPPTVHTLTPLSETAYHGLYKLTKSPMTKPAMTALYHRLVDAVEAGDTTLKLDGTLTADEIKTVFYYYRADYPQHFWCAGSLEYQSLGDKVVELTLTYTMQGTTLKKARENFNAAVAKFLAVAATGRNEYERELLLHDALAKHIKYKSGTNAHDAYGALVLGQAVCEGYARAFQYLLYQAGIQCLIAEGTSNNPDTNKKENHAWNVVRIDGQYYHVDLTWDDIDSAEVPVMYAYFNLNTAQITEDHTIRTTDCYALPNCTAVAANYHIKNDTQLKELTVDGVAAKLKGKSDWVHLYYTGGGEAFKTWFQSNYKGIARAMGITGGYRYTLWSTGNEVAILLK